MNNSIVCAVFGGFKKTKTRALWQWDYGMTLVFKGVNLPQYYTVHFANAPMSGEAKKQLGGSEGVIIPDEYLTTGLPVYAWVYLHEGESDGETVYMVEIPVQKRPKPTEEAPTPVQRDIIEEAIVALNGAVDNIDNFPVIRDGVWYVWDVSVNDYVSTGVAATGPQGDPGDDYVLTAADKTEIAGIVEAEVSDDVQQLVPAEVSEWLDEHVDPSTGYVVDKSLSIEGAAADGKATGKAVADLKSQIDDYFIKGINLFNPNDPDLVENVELKNTGATAEKTGYFASGFIPVVPGGTLCCHYPTGVYGTSSVMVAYNANKERVGYYTTERLTDSNGYNYIRKTFPANETGIYVRMTGSMAGANIWYMYVYADEMPAVYVPYTDKVTLSDDVIVPFENIQGVAVSKDQTDFIAPEPINLVDLSACVPGIIKNSTSNGGIDENSSWVTTDYIPVEPGETYALCIFPGIYYGAGFAGIPVYDDNKNQIARVKQVGGSVASIAERVTITIPDSTNAKYIRTSYYKSYTDNPKRWWLCQIFKASAWPTDMYIPYDGSDKLIGVGLTDTESVKYNALFGKSAMWNGDSICAADGDPQGGWPGRVAVSNGMMFKNYGISGGTIAENTGSNVHSVSGTLDGMLTDFPNADYIIIEGGTNDADILGDNGIGAFDPDDFSITYINALDKNTFSGALESVFYRLVTQMKGKHIGYLIPQKMGHTEVLVARRRVYFDRAKTIAQKWGIPVLDLWNDFYLNWRLSAHWDQTMTTAENEAAGNLYIDGQHLTTTGYTVEAPVIAEWMKSI